MILWVFSVNSETIEACYGLDVVNSRDLSTGHTNQTRLLTTGDGKKFIMRIYNKRQPVDIISREHGLLKHFSSNFAYNVPHLLPNRQGGTLSKSGDLQYAIYPYIPSSQSPYVILQPSKKIIHEISKLSASFAARAAEYPIPHTNEIILELQSYKNRLIAYLAGMRQENHNTPLFNGNLANRNEFFMNNIEDLVRMFTGYTPSSVAHTDQRKDNFIFSPGDEITGLLDFGNSMLASPWYDIAFTLKEHTLPQEISADFNYALLHEFLTAFHQAFESKGVNIKTDQELLVPFMRLSALRCLSWLLQDRTHTPEYREQLQDWIYRQAELLVHEKTTRGIIGRLR